MKNKAAQAANAPIIFEEIVMIIKIHSENFNVLFYKRSLLNPSNTLIIRSLLQMLNKYCTQSVNVIFTLAFYEHLRVAFYEHLTVAFYEHLVAFYEHLTVAFYKHLRVAFYKH